MIFPETRLPGLTCGLYNFSQILNISNVILLQISQYLICLNVTLGDTNEDILQYK
jgi:hypothetical protein